jgi:hypothetical protein
MDADDLLKQVAIPSPCTADWDAMPGDDRTRSCRVCGKPVHDIQVMTAEEAASVLAAPGGGACCRITKTRDGTVLTAGQRVSGRPSVGRFKVRLASLMAVIAGIAAALGLVRAAMEEESTVTMGAPCMPAQSATVSPPPTAVPSPGPVSDAGDQGTPADSAGPAP